MLDPKKISEIEQVSAFISETLPPLFGNMFKNLVLAGFTEDRAMTVLCTYITTAFRNN
jgi:hypothetical protein